jgi:abortive infection bacteriophage resistance protein
VPGQIKLLRQRGMTITDEGKAASYLERVGYYRLSGYWYPFRRRVPSTDARGKSVLTVLDGFVPGTEFRHALDLYVFDKRLRMLMLDAIERVEIGLRVDVGLMIGARDPWAHRNPVELHPDFAVKTNPKTNLIEHQEWMAKQDRLAARSREDFVEHFRKRYESPLPIWIAIELWDFGLLSRLVGGMRHADQETIAAKYGLPRRELLTTWLRAINHVRNICAHHGRLWNRSPSDQPKRIRVGEVPMLDHIASDAPKPLSNKLAPVRLYATAAAIQCFLRTINPTTTWVQRLKHHMASFPTVPATNVSHTGFPPGWEALPFWN